MKSNITKQRIIVTILASMTAAAVLWYTFVGPAWSDAGRKKQELSAATAKLESEKFKVRQADKISSALTQHLEALESAREKLVSGDTYLWILRTLNQFKVPNALEFDFVDEPVSGKWPYPSAVSFEGTRFLIKGSGYYHELGLFMAGFENEYPAFRFTRVGIAPQQPLEAERIAFTLELAGIVAPPEISAKSMLRASTR